MRWVGVEMIRRSESSVFYTHIVRLVSNNGKGKIEERGNTEFSL